MILLRQARTTDRHRLLELARELNSVNLPTESGEMAEMIGRSERSFAGKIRNRTRAVYLFCAQDLERNELVGASMIIAKHGTPLSPHYYLQVETEERYSHRLAKMFTHTCLRLRYSMDGPTEVGGLIVDPAIRGRPERPGKQVSWVRFLYIGKHPKRFESRVIAEILAPIRPDGGNPFWEHYGGPVTGLSLHEADRLSIYDKEFIRALFPEAPLYTFLLPDDVRASLGQAADQAKAAVKLLEQAGMTFLGQIDPFDAGPYYGATVADLKPVREFRTRRAIRGPAESKRADKLLMVGRDDATRGFRAITVPWDSLVADEVALPDEAFETLEISEGARLDSVELP